MQAGIECRLLGEHEPYCDPVPSDHEGVVVGVSVCFDGEGGQVHFFVDGICQGKAFEIPIARMCPVIDFLGGKTEVAFKLAARPAIK